MRSIAFLIAFMAMALFNAFCDALPHEDNFSGTLPSNFSGVLPNNVTSTDTGVSRKDDPDSLSNVPNLSPDVYMNRNRCYYDDVSEKWSDVGGKHSQYIHDAIWNMCDVIATFAGNTGFKKDDTMTVCKEVPKNTQGKDYDRSIAVIMTYRGPDSVFVNLDAQYSFNLMAQAMNCGAGGEFVVGYSSPRQWWEVKADPNRNDCKSNKYETVL